MITPPPLKKGDTVAVLSASGPCIKEKLLSGVSMLEHLGLNVVVLESCYASHGTYLAGPDDLRLRDLHIAFADKNIQGIIMARGGYGAARLLPYIDYNLVSQNPKVFVGFSDVTALHNVFNQFCNLITYHGPMVASCLGDKELHPLTLESFCGAIFGRKPPVLSQLTSLRPGNATGILTGGNLSVIASTLGTPYEIETRGRILFLEEIQETPYRVDRLLLQLKLSGKLRDAAGIVFGDFSPENLQTLQIAIHELVVSEGKPTIWGLPCGHTSPNITLPLGQNVTINDGLFYFG